jgi:hypothetical protein
MGLEAVHCEIFVMHSRHRQLRGREQRRDTLRNDIVTAVAVYHSYGSHGICPDRTAVDGSVEMDIVSHDGMEGQSPPFLSLEITLYNSVCHIGFSITGFFLLDQLWDLCDGFEVAEVRLEDTA